jgi:hypothetical protein
MAIKFSGEKYQCPCEGDIGQPNRIHGWKCAACGEYLQIYAEDRSAKQVIERVSVSDVKKGDLLVQDGSPLLSANEVLDVRLENGAYRIALREFGVLKKVSTDKEFNRILGSW